MNKALRFFTLIFLCLSLISIAQAYPNKGMLLDKNIKNASSEKIIVTVKEKAPFIKKVFKNRQVANSKAMFRKALAKDLNLRQSKEVLKNIFVVSGNYINIGKISATYNDEYYKVIEPDYRIEVESAATGSNTTLNKTSTDFRCSSGNANPPLYSNKQWNLYDTSGYDWDIDFIEAWEKESKATTNEVIVAVIDTGLDTCHEDLQIKYWINQKEGIIDEAEHRIDADGLDNDGNGYVDDLIGWDFALNYNYSMDYHGQGTRISGIIAAQWNKIGIDGISSKAKILPLKVTNEETNENNEKIHIAYIDSVLEAIQYVLTLKEKQKDLHIPIVNFSFGYPEYSNALYDAVKELENANILLVCPAGSISEEAPDTLFPAAFDFNNIITVASNNSPKDTDITNPFDNTSHYSPISVDLTAPGKKIITTNPNHTYAYVTGTAVASAHVSGVAAILAAIYPGEKAETYKSWILAGVKKDGYLEGYVRTSGRLSAKTAIEQADKEKDNPAPSSVSVSGYLTHDFNNFVNDATYKVKLSYNGKNKTVTVEGTGFFEFEEIPTNVDYTLTVIKDNKEIYQSEGSIGSHDPNLTIYLGYLNQKETSITGTVYNFYVDPKNNIPNDPALFLSNTAVKIKDLFTNDPYETKTDKQGNFILNDIIMGSNYKLEVPGYNYKVCFEDNNFHSCNNLFAFQDKSKNNVVVLPDKNYLYITTRDWNGEIIPNEELNEAGLQEVNFEITQKINNYIYKINTRNEGEHIFNDNQRIYEITQNAEISVTAKHPIYQFEPITVTSTDDSPIYVDIQAKNQISANIKPPKPDAVKIKKGKFRIEMKKYDYGTYKKQTNLPIRYNVKLLQGGKIIKEAIINKNSKIFKKSNKKLYTVRYRLLIYNKNKKKVLAKSAWSPKRKF